MIIINVLLWIKEYTIESIEIVIDTVSKHNQLQPILIDIPDNSLVAGIPAKIIKKNIKMSSMRSNSQIRFKRAIFLFIIFAWMNN